MARVMPSQVVQTIDDLFPHAAKNERHPGALMGNNSALLGILNLVNDIPDELIALTPLDYSDLILAKSTIEDYLAHSVARGVVGHVAHVKGFDAITVIRRVLAKCSDEYPPSATTELSFINDEPLRENIRRDLGAVERALNNAEWKAATVLAGATIEALLYWCLKEPSTDAAEVDNAVNALTGTRKRPFSQIDYWDLDQFIEVAAHLDLLQPDTSDAARLAKNFRNLIHPGRADRLDQTCDRATTHTAVGALYGVIRDLT